MKPFDVTFNFDSKSYGYMLARVNGRKAWQVERIYTLPPSLIKYKITLMINAREDQLNRVGVKQSKQLEEILQEIEQIVLASNVILDGYDEMEYNILVDQAGMQTSAVIEEQTRKPEHHIALTCWGLYN